MSFCASIKSMTSPGIRRIEMKTMRLAKISVGTSASSRRTMYACMGGVVRRRVLSVGDGQAAARRPVKRSPYRFFSSVLAYFMVRE